MQNVIFVLVGCVLWGEQEIVVKGKKEIPLKLQKLFFFGQNNNTS